MGVSIHYRGRLDDNALLPLRCDEIEDIAASMGWPTTRLDDDWSIPADATLQAGGRIDGHLGLKGIQITPQPDSESLDLFFDREGYLRCHMAMIMINEGVLQPETAWIHMKTQFAGPDIHIWVIGLLKYLKKRYISNLEVQDESEYWDTGDRQKLEEKMSLINAKLQSLTDALSSGRLGDLTGLSADEIASRIEQLLRNEKNRDAE